MYIRDDIVTLFGTRHGLTISSQNDLRLVQDHIPKLKIPTMKIICAIRSLHHRETPNYFFYVYLKQSVCF